MPITKSAKKALRQAARKQVFNIRRSNKANDAVKKLKKLVVGGKIDEAKKMLSTVYKALDKSVKGNTLKKNTASRNKSRLSAMIKRAQA